jgi:photosystem II stability/assembly factor-like uncharacterized protein
MNDEELGLRLSEELRRRINPPVVAPEAVHEHLRRLRSMREMRPAGEHRQGRLLRDLFGLAAAVGMVALLAGLLVWRSSQPTTAVPAPKNGIEAFSRIDSKTAWAESGSELYITRDGGQTWSQGTVPGGRSPLQVRNEFLGGSTGGTAPTAGSTLPADSTDTGDSAEPSYDWSSDLHYPDHYYPDFIDAEHGWLLSWTTSGTAAYGTAPDYLHESMTVWRTEDGARSWVPTKLPGTYKGIGALQFVDASHGWITILRADLVAFDASKAYPADATTILATTDGGTTWSVVSTIAAYVMPHFVSTTEAWGYSAAPPPWTSPNSVVHSTDGGRTWSTSLLPIPDDRRVIGWPSPPAISTGSVGIRLPSVNKNSPADDGSSGSLAILTIVSSDDGRTWRLDATMPVAVSGSININTEATTMILHLPAGQPIVLVDPSAWPHAPTGFQATFDGGATWTAYSTRGLPGMAVALAEWTSADDAWVVTVPEGGVVVGGQLYATQDAGKTWKPLLGAPAWPASP